MYHRSLKSTFNRRFLTVLIFTGSLFPALQAVAQQSKGRLADLAFIEGHWKATTPERTIEGVWLAPQGDNILGFMRMMTGEKASLYELLAYEQTEQGLISRVKHFKPGMIAQEEKDKFDQYNFLEATSERVILEKEGGLLRIIYDKRGNDQFAIMRGNQQDGKWQFNDLFVFNRVK